MAPYKIIKQGYMLKEPPSSKRGLRKVPSWRAGTQNAFCNTIEMQQNFYTARVTACLRVQGR